MYSAWARLFRLKRTTKVDRSIATECGKRTANGVCSAGASAVRTRGRVVSTLCLCTSEEFRRSVGRTIDVISLSCTVESMDPSFAPDISAQDRADLQRDGDEGEGRSRRAAYRLPDYF